MTIDDTDGVRAVSRASEPDLAAPRPAWRLGERARRQLLAGAAQRAGAAGLPGPGGRTRGRSDPHAALAAALRADTADALGRAGRRLQQALAALAAVDDAAGHDRRLAAAASALWACVVQREAMGLFDHRMLAETYAVPDALWGRMGARAESRPGSGPGPRPVGPTAGD